MPEPAPLYVYASETNYPLIEDEREDAQKLLLDELTHTVREMGVVIDSVLQVGNPAEQISAVARDVKADLLVTASHHPTLLARLFNMDKAPHIMHRAPCSVLVYQEKST
jgi:nucleotide-binding universal stress UspA family protein